MAQAKSRITVSFDSWKADNEALDLLGIVGHYIDGNSKAKTIVLALRDTFRCYSSENIKDHLLTVLREYQISNKVAFFAADNASNNNRALSLLASELNIDTDKQRLRCLGYIINLVSMATLYGIGKDCVDDVLQSLENNSADSSEAST